MKVRIKQATKQGYIECCVPGVVDLSFPNSKTRRGRVQSGGEICPTIMATNLMLYVIEPLKNDFGLLDYEKSVSNYELIQQENINSDNKKIILLQDK